MHSPNEGGGGGTLYIYTWDILIIYIFFNDNGSISPNKKIIKFKKGYNIHLIIQRGCETPRLFSFKYTIMSTGIRGHIPPPHPSFRQLQIMCRIL